MKPIPVILEGRFVRLEPLDLHHAEGLYAVGQEDSVWRYLLRPKLRNLEDARGFVSEARQLLETGTQIPFAIIERETEQVAGSTRYLDIRPADHGLEIGYTWLGVPYQRTAVNTECKYLLLRHAFETLGAVRVQLKTDARNLRSQQAIERLGAVREGVLRKHMTVWDGFIRDTVFYSILENEWPCVKARLEQLLSRSHYQ